MVAVGGVLGEAYLRMFRQRTPRQQRAEIDRLKDIIERTSKEVPLSDKQTRSLAGRIKRRGYRGIPFEQLSEPAQRAINEGRIFKIEVLGTTRVGYTHKNPTSDFGRLGGFVELSAHVAEDTYDGATLGKEVMILGKVQIGAYVELKGNTILDGDFEIKYRPPHFSIE